MTLLRHVSFVDCPGHDILMATMLTGAAVMDAALLLISAEMDCPQPQTREHLQAVQIMNLDKIIILQNKLDLIFNQEGKAQTNYKQIQDFIDNTVAKKAPIIPISAQFKYNINYVLDYIVNYIPVPQRQIRVDPIMIVIRSFDINKPGTQIEELKGGIAGGSILQGVLRVGDDIEIRPGIVESRPDGSISCQPIQTKVTSLFAEKNQLLYAIPGGLIGVGTLLDPSFTIADSLVGNIIGYPGRLPDVFLEIEIEYYLLSRLLGVKSSEKEENQQIQKIQKGEYLLVNIGSTQSSGRVLSCVSKFSSSRIGLSNPVCTQIGEKIALSRKINRNWRLIGWGTIKQGRRIYSDRWDELAEDEKMGNEGGL